MGPWYLLLDGTSEDGMGSPRYKERTLEPAVARMHLRRCRKDPYNVGKVVVITDTEAVHVYNALDIKDPK
jgi:hypothetical protein